MAFGKKATCSSAGRVTAARLLISFLALSSVGASTTNAGQILLPPIPPSNLSPEAPAPAEHTFTLRQIYHHGTYRHPRLHRKKDVTHADSQLWLAAEDGFDKQRIPSLRAKSRPTRIERLADRRPAIVDPLVAEGRRRGSVSVLGANAWTVDDVPTPNISDKETVINLAYMASNAYVQKENEADWEDLGGYYNRSADFGWEGDGLRGHVYADDTNSTIVIGLKGTSPAVFDGEGTTTNDKVNDNLFFSCCCAQQGQWSWHKVCDCATSTFSCNNTCVVDALREENKYYTAARELYSNVTELYPAANVWLIGHSLGGAVSSLLGLTYGLPVVTFEAPPEALAAGRLGLPVPPGADPNLPQARQYTGSYHFGHTADPIFIGTCNGATATCSFAGYAMETACHTGMECVYDVVADKGWRVGIGTHKIRAVIHDVIMKYDDIAECRFTPECRDCAKWKMYESNGTETTTTSKSSTSTKTRTRTATCKTPGWWGCLDETTTTTTGESTTTTSSTRTCKTPGWFGCKDKTTSTTTITTTTDITTTRPTTPTTSLSTTCEHPGRFWGCHDPSPTTVPPDIVLTSHVMTAAPTETPSPSPSPSPSREPKISIHRCVYRSWFGWCKEWADEPADYVYWPDEI